MKKILLIIFIAIAFLGNFNISSAEFLDPIQTQAVQEDYSLLAPIPGVNKIDNTNTLGTYLNFFFKFAISVCAGLAVLMIVIYGVQYMGDGSVFGHTEAKSKIGSAIMGLLLALGAYALLNTINPDLVGSNGIKIKQVTITLSPGQQYRLSETQATTKKFARTKYYDTIKATAAKKEYNIPHCLLQVAIQRESGGVAGLVGHDEEAPAFGIPSRKNFVNSGKKYSGTTFTSSQSLITDRGFHNDDHKGNNLFSASKPTAVDLGLDWRYSHAIGMFGVTFYPAGESYGDYTKGIYMVILKKTVFPKDLFNTNTDILVAAEMMSSNYKLCNNNVEQTYRKYGSGRCDGSNAFTNVEAPLRKNLYDQCVAQDK